jgi:imidazolonepropionase-like amidohydrolase
VVRGSSIIDVGAVGQVAIPSNAKVIDSSDKWIMPGLVCTHSHVGGVGAAGYFAWKKGLLKF